MKSIVNAAMLMSALLIPFVTARSEETPMTIDLRTVKHWSEPYRGWHYYPHHVIPAKPDIEGFEAVHMTDVPTIFQLPGEKRWYMTFIGFDGQAVR